MVEYNTRKGLDSRFKEMERRLRSLETAPQLAFSSIENGSIKEYDQYGNLSSQYGEQFDGTHTSASFAGPTPPTPDQLSVDGVAGGIDVSWGGAFVGGALTPMDYAWIEIYADLTSDFVPMPSNMVGTIVSSQQGKQFIAYPDTQTRYVVLITRTQSGKFSEPSVVVPGTPQAIEAGEVTPPLAPTGLSVTPGWGYNAAWVPKAKFDLTWTAVTQDTSGNSLTPAGYEVWYKTGSVDWAFIGASATNSFSVTGLNLDTTYQFQVRALSQVPSEFSGSVSSSYASSSVTETVPDSAAPTFTSRLGLVIATSTGMATGGATPPGYVTKIEYGLKETAGGTYAVVGSTSAVGAVNKITLTPDLDPGDTFYGAVRFVSAYGTKGAWVADAGNPHVIVGVVDTDLVDTTIEQSLSNLNVQVTGAQAAANGKNKNWYQDAQPPTTGNTVGDTWFDTNDGNKIYRWSGSAWVSAALGSNALDANIVNSINSATTAASAAQNTAGTALTAANGKNKNWYQDAQPGLTGNIVGDNWFDTNDGYKLYRWNGSAWVAAALGASALDTTVVNSISSAATAASAAQTTADGKNKITYGTTTPTTATPGRPGDIYYVRSGNTITGQYLNTAGTGTASGNTWTAQTLTHQTIASVNANNISTGILPIDRIGANTIDAGKMNVADVQANIVQTSLLDAGKITSGYLNSARIEANSITADKVVIGSSENLLPNGMFEEGNRAMWDPAMQAVAGDAAPGMSMSLKTVAGSGSLYAYSTNIDLAGFDVIYGEEYLFELWIKASLPNSRLYMEVRDQNVAHAATWNPVPGETHGFGSGTSNRVYPIENWVVPTTWTKVTAVATFNAGVTRARMYTWYFNHPNGSERNAEIFVGGVRIRRRTKGALLVRGSITAESGIIASLDAGKINTGEMDAQFIKGRTVTADKLLVGVGQNLHPDPGHASAEVFTRLASDSLATTGWTQETTPNAIDGKRAVRITHAANVIKEEVFPMGVTPYSVTAGAVYRMAYTLRGGPGGTVAFRLRVLSADGTTSTMLDLTPDPAIVDDNLVHTAEWTAPDGVLAVLPYLVTTFGDPTLSFSMRLTSPSFGMKVSGELIVDGAVTSRSIAAEAISTDKLAANAVTAGKIEAGAVTAEKLQIGSPVGADIMVNGGFERDDFGFSRFRDFVVDGVLDLETLPMGDYFDDLTATQISMIQAWTHPTSGDNVKPQAGLRYLQVVGNGGATASSYSEGDAEVLHITQTATGGQAFNFVVNATAYDRADVAVNAAQKNGQNNLNLDNFILTMEVYTDPGSSASMVYQDSRTVYLSELTGIFTSGSQYAWNKFEFKTTIPDDLGLVSVLFKLNADVHSHGRAIAFDNIQILGVTGRTLIADGVITTDMIAANQINSEHISSDAIDGKVITGATFRTSEDVGVSDVVTAWTGTVNNSSSTASGASLPLRRNLARDPAGVNPSIWVQTNGAVATAGSNWFGRGGTVQSAAGALTLPIQTPVNGSLTVQGQFNTSVGSTINAYVHESGTSRDGTKFTQTCAAPSGTPTNAVWHIAKNGRFYWIPSSSTFTGTSTIKSSTATGTAIQTGTIRGKILLYNGRPISPVNSNIWAYEEISSESSISTKVYLLKSGDTAMTTVTTVSPAYTNATNIPKVTITATSAYMAWAAVTQAGSGSFPDKRWTYYIKKLSATGVAGSNVSVGSIVGDWLSTSFVSGIKASVDNTIYLKISEPDSYFAYVYWRVTDSGTKTVISEATYEAVNDVTYPDDLNGAATTFSYSTADSQISTARAQTNAQIRYIEDTTTRKIYTYDKTRAKYSMPLGLSAVKGDPGQKATWVATNNWSTVPTPVITFNTTAQASSFMVENTATPSFWFSGSDSDAGGGGGGILDANGLRGYAPNGGLSTNLDFTTGKLTATGASIEGVLTASDAGGSNYVQLIDGKIQFYASSVLRATVDHTNFEDTGWITYGPNSSFLPYSTGSNPRYRKIGKTVYLIGEIKPATTTVATDINSVTGGVSFGTLPAAYRPATIPGRNIFVCQGSQNTTFSLTVNTDGTTTISRYGYGNTDVAISTSTWLTFSVCWLVD